MLQKCGCRKHDEYKAVNRSVAIHLSKCHREVAKSIITGWCKKAFPPVAHICVPYVLRCLRTSCPLQLNPITGRGKLAVMCLTLWKLSQRKIRVQSIAEALGVAQSKSWFEDSVTLGKKYTNTISDPTDINMSSDFNIVKIQINVYNSVCPIFYCYNSTIYL